VNDRFVVFAAGAAAIALVVAQIAAPAWSFTHSEPYALALGVAVWVLVAYAARAARGADGPRGRWLALAAAGAALIAVTGLAAGLLGPDAQTLARAPGVVEPLPDLGAAAVFPLVDADGIARGDARVLVRRRGHSEVDIAPHGRTLLGTAVLVAEPHLAAYVEAYDAKGRRLTITQPTNQAFLSPVLQFGKSVTIGTATLPAEDFAVPARHRQVAAVYIDAKSAAAMQARRLGDRSVVLFSVRDDAGHVLPQGIGFAPSGGEAQAGDLRLRVTIGSYPQLLVGSAPLPVALWLGGAAIVLGLLLAFVRLPRTRLTALACGVLAAALASCTRIETAAQPATSHAWTKPDTLRVGAYEEPDSLNPAITSMAFAGDVFQLIYNGLIRFDDRGKPVPDLALEVPSRANGGISADGKTLTYHLVPNARWQDGVPLTADDVVFTYRALMNPANNVPTRIGYDRIAKIDAPDAHTVRIVLREPYAPAIYLFKDLGQGSIMPKHLLAEHVDLNQVPFNTNPVGSGPYRLTGWQHGSMMTFDANPEYFRGPPKIKHIVWKFIYDQNTLLAQLRTHEIDMAYALPTYLAEQVRGIEGVRIAQTSTLHWEHLVFNVRHPPLDERAVRLALAYAMDEKAIFSKIYHNLGRPWPTDQNPDYGWSDKSLGYYPHDAKRSAALLDGAGWRLGPDGYRYKNGRRLAFSISTVAGVKAREAIEVLLQSEWRDAGVDLTVKNYPAQILFAPAAAGGMLYGGKTDAAIFTWSNSTPDPDDETYIGPDRFPPVGQNVMFFSDSRIGRDQQAALRIYEPAKRKPYYLDIQRIILDNVPEYTFDWEPEIDAVNVDLHGVRPVPVGSDFWNVADWQM
jgi:peptide/nickel transport system substrate-binding protein